MHTFIDDDAGYVAWCQTHPDGFVVNTYRTPSTRYLKLHRATCAYITQLQAGAKRWTRDYAKVCALDAAELHTWAMHLGGTLDLCPLCQP
jgi:hypothetical protein